jgi:hypothetical protein
MKSITRLVYEIGLANLICTSFEEAENNGRKMNLVIIDDSDIYLTYKLNGVFGEFVCWVEDEFKEDETIYDSMIEYVKDIYYRTEEEIDDNAYNGRFIFDFKPY